MDKESMFLPLLATRGVFCFPFNQVTFDVGRKKSLIAIEQAINAYESCFILVSQKNPEVNEPSNDDLFKCGIICKIVSQKKNSDKSTRLVIEGMDRVKINNIIENDNTLYCECNLIETIYEDEPTELALLNVLSDTINEYLKDGGSAPSTLLTKAMSKSLKRADLDSIAQIFELNIKNKQELIEEPNFNLRITKLIESIKSIKEIKAIEQEISTKLKDKFDKNQRDYYLREKIKECKEELGENDSSDPSNLYDEIEKNPYPDNVKTKLKEELKKLDMMMPTSPDAATIRNYIDWMMKTPWYQKTEDKDDIKEVEKVLNDDHYGLEKPKERILEYLAVKKLTNSLKAPILCFSGAPGVGKTSLALSIAKALGRKYVKVSLGGVSDEAEIRGHRRTYVGALPGRIIQGMKKAGVINPVFILDEIDKLGKDYKGDPSNALLDVLDPEQNKIFSDNFLEEPYDLSNVMFIATANYLQNVPAPLLDRLEIIELSSYTEQEKLEIAKRYLVKKQVEQNGIKELTLSDEVILTIINNYTREAGVRQLERLIGKIARKIAVNSLKDENTSHVVTKDNLVDYLGKSIFDYTKKENKDQIGIVTGLAYTEYGGDILPIEAVHFEGKGNLIITGNLGKVMNESASIALGYVKANAKKYEIDPNIFEHIDIHIHCPEGAIPKDGPSAGVTLTTCLISSLSNKSVRSDIAMTGEITLRGNVLPIGGLREKSIAAHRSKIKTIFIPFENTKDIEDIPESVRNELEIIPVKHIDEIISKVINNETK